MPEKAKADPSGASFDGESRKLSPEAALVMTASRSWHEAVKWGTGEAEDAGWKPALRMPR
jgi:hypothetical protein